MRLLPCLAVFLTLATAARSAAPLRIVVAGTGAREAAAQLQGTSAQVSLATGAEDGSLAMANVLVLAGDFDTSRAGGDTWPTPEAVERFAARGGGVVVLGTAITAGAWLKPVAGGAWTANSRKFPGQMMLYPLTDAHPITRETSAFDLNDDTAYDLDLDAAITVLGSAFTPKVTSSKKDSRAPEKLDRANVYDVQPQMWTFEAADRHRAFVLLPASPESLTHASIRTLLRRGIAWAGRREDVDELCAAADLATLRYPQNGPRRAADTVKSFALEPGFHATAIASEPLIAKPIAMQWDARGRLWIAETPEYPNGRRPLTEAAWKETGVLRPDDYERPATDRISILEDTDGDGVMDRKTVFCSGLELVTGFCLWRDGVIAVAQPDIVWVHGTGAAQQVERLFTGFTPGDTHFVANHFIVAPDGWIYADTGSGPRVESVTHPELKVQLGSGMFRFKPDGSAIEQVCAKGGNGFGAEVTSGGELFFGQATSGSPVEHVALPEWILNKGTGLKIRTGAESVINQRKVIRPDMPTRVPYMQIDVVGGYSSACASTVNEGGAWPAPWSGGVFCTEPILDIIHFEKLVPNAATFTGEMTRADAEWLRAEDFRFFPVDVQFGPDGAMYVLDFYNPIVAHSDSRGPRHSRAGASVRPDREHYFGRIYRIQHDQAAQLAIPDLSSADAGALVRAFTNPNKQTRFTAHRLLLDRADAASVEPALREMAAVEKFPPARILALWALQRIGRLDESLLASALHSDEAAVRKSALLIVEARGPASTTDVSPSLRDPDPRVRLTAFRAMASSPLTKAGAAALLAVLPQLDDEWSRTAAIVAASSNAGPVLEAALAATMKPGASEIALASSLAASLAEKRDSAGLGRVILAAADAAPELSPLVLAILQQAASPLIPAPATALDDALAKLLGSPDLSISASALPFAVHWKTTDALQPAVSAKIAALLPLLADSTQSDDRRSTIATALIRARAADARIIEAVLATLRAGSGDALLLELVNALASTGDPAIGKPLVAVLPNLSPLGQTAVFDALTTRAEWAGAVLDALAARELPATLLGPAKLSKLRLHPDPAVAKRAAQILAEVGAGTNAAKDELIAKLQPEIEAKAGDPAKGKALFAGVCAACHKFGGTGNEVGPVLDGIGVHGTHELLVHILDPSRVVDNEHRTWNLALKSGQFVTGIIARENDRALTLKLPGGLTQEVRAEDIRSRQDTGLSLMPEGLEALGADGLRDVLAYLSEGSGKFRALNLGAIFTTDTGGGLYQSRDKKDDSVQPVKYGVATVEGVPFSLPDPSTTPTGGNVIVLKNSDGGSFASTMPQRVEIAVGFAAGNLHFLGGVAGWGGGPDAHRPAMKVTIEHADGKQQVEELFSGDVFIDYVSGAEVPGSKRVDGLTKRAHVRYFSLRVENRAPIVKVVLESYKNGIAPTTLAITADTDAPKPHAPAASAP